MAKRDKQTHPSYSLNKKCKDCGKHIKNTSTYCKSCFQKGERNHAFGKKQPKELLDNGTEYWKITR